MPLAEVMACRQCFNPRAPVGDEGAMNVGQNVPGTWFQPTRPRR